MATTASVASVASVKIEANIPVVRTCRAGAGRKQTPANQRMTARHCVARAVLAAAFLLGALSAKAAHAGWSPAKFADENTLAIRTQEKGADPHWFYVWMVVIDDEVFVRLGNRAASRVENNVSKPLVAVRVGGEEFAAVETEPVPEMSSQVADAMAAKYWSDLFFRYLPHPLTLRLKPAAAD